MGQEATEEPDLECAQDFLEPGPREISPSPGFLEITQKELSVFFGNEKLKKDPCHKGWGPGRTPTTHGSSSSGSNPFVMRRRSARDRWAASRPVSVTV
jgi:hypothetical protein